MVTTRKEKLVQTTVITMNGWVSVFYCELRQKKFKTTASGKQTKKSSMSVISVKVFFVETPDYRDLLTLIFRPSILWPYPYGGWHELWLIVHVGHVRQSNHINVSLIHVPRSASVHIMAVDTHTTVPNRREQNVGTLSSAPVLSLQSCLQLDGTCGSQQTP